jgi:hypothetical protein
VTLVDAQVFGLWVDQGDGAGLAMERSDDPVDDE